MTHVEKMRLQAALKALQGRTKLPRCAGGVHSEPRVFCRRRASGGGYGVTGGPVLLQTHMKWRYTEAKISPTNAAHSSADAAQILSSVFPTTASAAPPHFPHTSLVPSPSSHEMENTKRTPPTKAHGRMLATTSLQTAPWSVSSPNFIMKSCAKCVGTSR